MSVSAIQIGLHPDAIDYGAPEFAAFAGLSRETLRAANDDNLALLRHAGYEADGCQIDFGETALDTIRAMLGRKRYDAVLIGAGVRLTAGNTLLFESIVNLVHTALPHARFIFNHSATATADDIRRHYPDPASTVPLDIPRDLEEAGGEEPRERRPPRSRPRPAGDAMTAPARPHEETNPELHSTDVLVVGGGPTGMTLAGDLARAGPGVRTNGTNGSDGPGGWHTTWRAWTGPAAEAVRTGR